MGCHAVGLFVVDLFVCVYIYICLYLYIYVYVRIYIWVYSQSGSWVETHSQWENYANLVLDVRYRKI